jgi:hypothetical protein
MTKQMKLPISMTNSTRRTMTIRLWPCECQGNKNSNQSTKGIFFYDTSITESSFTIPAAACPSAPALALALLVDVALAPVAPVPAAGVGPLSTLSLYAKENNHINNGDTSE